MKKTPLFLLAVLMMFAFTQCDSKSKDTKQETKSTESMVNDTQKSKDATKEFLNQSASLNEMITAIGNGDDCDKIEEALKAISEKYSGITYEENEKIRDDEKEEIMKLYNEFATVAEAKAKELGCK